MTGPPGKKVLRATATGGFRLVAVTQVLPVTDGSRPGAVTGDKMS